MVLWGAQALMAVEQRFTAHLIGKWRRYRSSLRCIDALRLAG
jgi:hypothetical protein